MQRIISSIQTAVNRNWVLAPTVAFLSLALSASADAQHMNPQQWQLHLRHQQMLQWQMHQQMLHQQQMMQQHQLKLQQQQMRQQHLLKLQQQQMLRQQIQQAATAQNHGYPRPEGYAWLVSGIPYYWQMGANGPKVFRASNYDPDHNYKTAGPANVFQSFGSQYANGFRP